MRALKREMMVVFSVSMDRTISLLADVLCDLYLGRVIFERVE